MRRTKMVGLAVLTLIVAGAAATPAAAQARGYVGFGAGVSLPMGHFKDDFKTGWLGQVIAGVTGPNGMLGGRIDGMYARNSLKGTVKGHLSLLGVNADLVVTPGKRPAKVHPYILGGVGFYNAKEGLSGGCTGCESETKFAWNLGAGLQIHTGNKMDIFTEARFISVMTSGDHVNFLPISVGVRFGGV